MRRCLAWRGGATCASGSTAPRRAAWRRWVSTRRSCRTSASRCPLVPLTQHASAWLLTDSLDSTRGQGSCVTSRCGHLTTRRRAGRGSRQARVWPERSAPRQDLRKLHRCCMHAPAPHDVIVLCRFFTFTRGLSYSGDGCKPSDIIRAGDLAELADHLGARRFFVAGMSGGGPYALATLSYLPDRVQAAIVNCAAGSWGEQKRLVCSLLRVDVFK